MQGVIAKCLEELVQERFGKPSWNAILARSGLGPGTIFTGDGNITDEMIVTVMRHTCEVLEITPLEVAEVFKEYWVRVFAPKLYHDHCGSARARPTRGAGSARRRDDRPVLVH